MATATATGAAISVPRAGLVALAAALPILFAASKGGTERDPFKKRNAAGGWYLEWTDEPQNAQVGEPAFDAAMTTALIPVGVWNEKATALKRSTVHLVDTRGRARRRLDLQGRAPVEWLLATDGRHAAVRVERLDDPDAPATVLLFATSGPEAAPIPRTIPDEAALVAGRDHLALVVPAEDGTGAPTATFLRWNGDRIGSQAKLSGAVAAIAGGGGFVSLGGGSLVRLDATLAKQWSVDVPFAGTVAVAADGSRIVAADSGSEPGRRRIVVFDGEGARVAETAFDDAHLLEIAVAPDGSSFLVAGAPVRTEDETHYDASPEVRLTCFGADGSVRWTAARPRDVPSRVWSQLHLAAKGAFAAAAFDADEEGARGADLSAPHLVLFDAAGNVLYETKGPFDAFALDPTGDALWTSEGTLLSRLPLRSLRSVGR